MEPALNESLTNVFRAKQLINNFLNSEVSDFEDLRMALIFLEKAEESLSTNIGG